MRREELFNAVHKIVKDLVDSKIQETFSSVLDGFRHSEKEKRFQIPLDVFRQYSILTHTYDEKQRKVCEIVGIAELLDARYWIMISKTEDPTPIIKMNSNISFAINYLPKVLSLIEQDYISAIRENEPEVPEELKGKVLMNVLVIEEKDQFSSPQRLSYLFEGISDLYFVFAKIEKESESDLIVLACDSGSDKSFDFLGLAKIMEQVKESIIQIWDRRVFNRQKHMSDSIDLIAKALPVIEKVEELKKDGTIESELAEILKRKAINGATKFMEAGATIPELDGVSSHSPRQLMKPEPKLLVSTWSDEKEKVKKPNKQAKKKGKDEPSDFNDEEVELLKDLLKKAKKKSKKQGKKKTT